VSEAQVFLAGEGPNELESWCGDPVYQNAEFPGVIETLLDRVQAQGWAVIGACKWCQIRKFRAKGPTPNESQNVLGLTYAAKRAGAKILVFVRDADDCKERPRQIELAIQTAEKTFPEVTIVGGTAVPVLEGWILAMLNERDTEDLGKKAAQTRLEVKGIPPKNTRAMIDIAAKVVPENLPADATSLCRWMARAKEILLPFRPRI
jgi:hypothetical protein